jgi:hypothetical protein
MTRTDSEPYTAAISAMEAQRETQAKPVRPDAVTRDAEDAARIFDEVIEVELKRAQFALQTAHYRSRVDIPLRGPSPRGRVATLYAARGDQVSTMIQFIYATEALGVISVAIFRFSKGLRQKPANWPEDLYVPLASFDLNKVQDLIKTFITSLGES